MQEAIPHLVAPPGVEPVLSWFALKVRSNFEKVSSEILREKGYDQLSPSYPSRRYWSDRVKVIDQPLFPGYIFCRFPPSDWLPVARTPGVVQVVGFGGKFIPVDDQEITALRTLINSSSPISPRPFLQVGRRVLIKRGPLAGVEGILEEVLKGFRIVVSITLLQRSVSAEVDVEWVTPVQ